MESPRVHFVCLSGEVRGPLAVEQLRDLGEVGLITPGTEIGESAQGPWIPLASLPIAPEVFPPKAALGLKAATFEEINQTPAPAIEVDALKEVARRPPASLRGREVVVSPKVARLARDGDPANDVQAMVLEVGRRIAAHTPETVLPPPTRSRRWVWFAALAGLGTLGILSIPWFYPDRKSDEFTFSILAGWIVLFNGFVVAALMIDRRLTERVQGNQAKMDVLK